MLQSPLLITRATTGLAQPPALVFFYKQRKEEIILQEYRTPEGLNEEEAAQLAQEISGEEANENISKTLQEWHKYPPGSPEHQVITDRFIAAIKWLPFIPKKIITTFAEFPYELPDLLYIITQLQDLDKPKKTQKLLDIAYQKLAQLQDR